MDFHFFSLTFHSLCTQIYIAFPLVRYICFCHVLLYYIEWFSAIFRAFVFIHSVILFTIRCGVYFKCALFELWRSFVCVCVYYYYLFSCYMHSVAVFNSVGYVIDILINLRDSTGKLRHWMLNLCMFCCVWFAYMQITWSILLARVIQ